MKVSDIDAAQLEYLDALAEMVQGRFESVTYDEALIIGSNLIMARNVYALNKRLKKLGLMPGESDRKETE